MALAAALLPPGAEPPLAVRDSQEVPWCGRTEDLAALVRRERALIGDGRVAVIAPPAAVAGTAATLGLSPGPDLDAPVAVLAPEQAKGLEFDSVIVVDPAGIGQSSARGWPDLYGGAHQDHPCGSGWSARVSCLPYCRPSSMGPCSTSVRTGGGDAEPGLMDDL